jgi:hypothetical protein
MNEAAVLAAQKIFEKYAERKGQFRQIARDLFFKQLEPVNIERLRANVQLIASSEGIPCGNGHSLGPFRN